MRLLYRLLALFALSLPFAVANDTAPVSAASGCNSGVGLDTWPHRAAAWCGTNLNFYSPQFSQLGEQVRVKAKFNTGPYSNPATREPNYRYGPYTNIIGNGVPSGSKSEVYGDGTYPYADTREYQLNNWTQTSYPSLYNHNGTGYLQGKAYSPAEFWYSGSWLRVIVQCGAGAPWHAGDKVYASGTNSFYTCGTFGGDGVYATSVNYEVGFN